MHEPVEQFLTFTLYKLRRVGISELLLQAGIPVTEIALSVANSPALLTRVHAQVLGTDDTEFEERFEAPPD